MVFIAEAFGAWLLERLADAGHKRLSKLLLGTEQQQALRQAATAAVWRTAEELRPEDSERAAELARVVEEVFRRPMPARPSAGQAMLLEALQANVADQIAVLGDADMTGISVSSAALLGVTTTGLAERLAGNLFIEIVASGASKGLLTPLADQLNHDLTHLQGQQLSGQLARLAVEVQRTVTRLEQRELATSERQAPWEQRYQSLLAFWPLPKVESADPYAIGVLYSRRAERAHPSEHGRPPYVPRTADETLAGLLNSQPLILVRGQSRAGKSRTAFEVAARELAGWRLLIPKDREALAGAKGLRQ